MFTTMQIYMGNIEGKIILILQEEISLYIFIKKSIFKDRYYYLSTTT